MRPSTGNEAWYWYWIPVTGTGSRLLVLDPGYWILDTGYWIPDMGHFWRHFAVLTIISGPGLKQDHLFLVREG